MLSAVNEEMGVEHCECGAGKKVGLQDRVLVTRRACIPRCPAMHAYRSRCRCSVINRTSPMHAAH